MPPHPLEPLTAEEIQSAVSLLQSVPVCTATTRIISIILKEPPKEEVHSWPNGHDPDRQAVAVLLDNATNAASSVVVNLTGGAVTCVRPAPPCSQPTLSLDEQIECEQAVLTSPLFQAALEKHYGVRDTSLVMVDIWSAGYYGSEEERTQRLTRPLCFLRSDPADNGYARPLEGIRPLVDLNKMEVIRVEEYGDWPLPPESCNYSADRVPNQRADIKPLSITQAEGPSFVLKGNQMEWQNWKFVIGFSAREGLTIHHLRYRDGDRDRSILYNSAPFASPNAYWRQRAGFVNHHVWVTPYHPDENYAAGDFPNQSCGGDGLMKWTSADRPIANKDVVFWYTFGHTHIPRLEDYPVMPTAYIGFLLKPNGFFDRNPANDVPPEKASGKAGAGKHCAHC